MTEWNFRNRNISEYRDRNVSNFLAYILTDDNSYVMVGESEDKKLVWNQPTQWSFKEKST